MLYCTVRLALYSTFGCLTYKCRQHPCSRRTRTWSPQCVSERRGCVADKGLVASSSSNDIRIWPLQRISPAVCSQRSETPFRIRVHADLRRNRRLFLCVKMGTYQIIISSLIMRRQEQPQVPFVLSETCTMYCFSWTEPNYSSGPVDLPKLHIFTCRETPHYRSLLPPVQGSPIWSSKKPSDGSCFSHKVKQPGTLRDMELCSPSAGIDLSHFEVFLSGDFTRPIPGLDHSSKTYPLQLEASKLVNEETYSKSGTAIQSFTLDSLVF